MVLSERNGYQRTDENRQKSEWNTNQEVIPWRTSDTRNRRLSSKYVIQKRDYVINGNSDAESKYGKMNSQEI